MPWKTNYEFFFEIFYLKLFTSGRLTRMSAASIVISHVKKLIYTQVALVISVSHAWDYNTCCAHARQLPTCKKF
jgi:hypothetical protein